MRVLGVILAGGKSSRMGGGDKARLTIGEKTLIEITFEKLARQTDAQIIAGPDNFGLPVPAVPDRKGTLSGPLAGVLSANLWALKSGSGFDVLVTVPVDSPFFPDDLVKTLASRVPGFAVTKVRPHPIFAVWPVGLERELERYRENARNPSLMGFLEALKATPVGFKDEKAFFNINRPEDLALARVFETKT